MTLAAAMLDTHPNPRAGAGSESLAETLDVLEDCAQSCAMCADACLAEETVAELRRCIRLNLDCADVCMATAAILGRQTEGDPGVARAVLEACITACEVCAEECERHADVHEHCRVCAQACRRCAEACREALAAT